MVASEIDIAPKNTTIWRLAQVLPGLFLFGSWKRDSIKTKAMLVPTYTYMYYDLRTVATCSLVSDSLLPVIRLAADGTCMIPRNFTLCYYNYIYCYLL